MSQSILQKFSVEHDYVLFFTPEAGVTPHFTAQSILARGLAKYGVRSIFIGCDSLLNWCPNMSNFGITNLEDNDYLARKKETCARCMISSCFVLNHFGLSSIQMSQLVDDHIRMELNTVLNNIPDDLKTLTYDGIYFGCMTAREIVFSHKVYEFDQVSPNVRTVWLRYIMASITSYLVTKKLLQILPIKRIAYYNEYPTNLGAYHAAKKAGVACGTVFGSSAKGCDQQRINIFPASFNEVHRDLILDWYKFRNISLTQPIVDYITDDLTHRFCGASSFIYSPTHTGNAYDVYTRLNLDPSKKTIVAYTSSMDEMSAYKLTMDGLGLKTINLPQPFVDQATWLCDLIRYVDNKDDCQLVIRIHPREGKNSRFNFSSTHLLHLQKMLPKESKNCRIVWPEENISSYDLADIADVALTSWSTIGLELARFGVPVLTTVQNYSYPSDDFLTYGGDTPAQYYSMLDSMLNCSTTSIDTILRAYRCFYLFQMSYNVDVSDLIPSNVFFGIPEAREPKDALKMTLALINEHTVLEQNLLELQQSQHSNIDQQKFLASSLVNAAFKFFKIEQATLTGNVTIVVEDGVELSTLVNSISQLANSHEYIWFLVTGDYVTVVANQQPMTKYSKLLSRLFRLINQLYSHSQPSRSNAVIA